MQGQGLLFSVSWVSGTGSVHSRYSIDVSERGERITRLSKIEIIAPMGIG